MMYFFAEFIHFINGAYAVGSHLLTAGAFVFCGGGRSRNMFNLVSGFILLVVWCGAEELEDVVGVEF